MSEIKPALVFEWTGGVMVPRQPKAAARWYEDGQLYRLEAREDRSDRSHRSFHAQVREVWESLPDHLADKFASPEHLRKWALMKSGFRNERHVTFGSEEDARRATLLVQPMDDFAIVTWAGCVVTVYTAESQSYKAMGKQRFQESKQAVLDVLSKLIGVSVNALRKNAGEAA